MSEKKPKPIFSSIETLAKRNQLPVWVPASGRAGYGFDLKDLPRDARLTLALVSRVGVRRYDRDGSWHKNMQSDLPDGVHYREFTVAGRRSIKHGSAASEKGRFVIGSDGSVYYTATHYDRSPKGLTLEQKNRLRDHIEPAYRNAMYRVKTTGILQRRMQQRMAELERRGVGTRDEHGRRAQQHRETRRPVDLTKHASDNQANQGKVTTVKQGTRAQNQSGGTTMATSKSPLTPQFARVAKPPAPKPLTPTFNAASGAQQSKPPAGPAPVLKPRGGPPGPGSGSPSTPSTGQVPSPRRPATVKPPEPAKTLTQNFNQQARGPKR